MGNMEGLRARLAELLGFAVPLISELRVYEMRPWDGYVEQAVSFAGDEDEVPALLLAPESPCGAGVVSHHQHHGQWRIGKSEVAGRCGDRWQAFGPALARRGVTVLAHDAVGFEDRRPGSGGTDPRESDADEYFKTMCYRLVRGRPLMCTVLADAAAAHSVLAGLEQVDETAWARWAIRWAARVSCCTQRSLDQRIAFAVSSGSACTYRQRMARETGTDAAGAIPGVLQLADLDDIIPLIAPRPLLLCSAEEDEYSYDAVQIFEAAARVYRDAGASQALQHHRARGEHALTRERFDDIIDWVTGQLREPRPPARNAQRAQGRGDSEDRPEQRPAGPRS